MRFFFQILTLALSDLLVIELVKGLSLISHLNFLGS